MKEEDEETAVHCLLQQIQGDSPESSNVTFSDVMYWIQYSIVVAGMNWLKEKEVPIQRLAQNIAVRNSN